MRIAIATCQKKPEGTNDERLPDFLKWAERVDQQTKPRIGELELIEPTLFFAQNSKSAPLFVRALEALT